MSDHAAWNDDIDPELLDRLADGELTLDETRQLVDQLESSPDGWRQCALAYMEAQALARELGRLDEPIVEESTSQRSPQAVEPEKTADFSTEPKPRGAHSPVQRDANSARWQVIWQRPFFVAATIFVAFALGLYARTVLFEDSSVPDGGLTEVDDRSGVPSGNQQNATTLVGGEQPSSGRVQFVYNGDDDPAGLGGVEVPVYERSSLPQPPGMELPAEVRQLLKESDVSVQSERQLVNVQADDGRNVVVPVETFRFVPSDNSRYQ